MLKIISSLEISMFTFIHVHNFINNFSQCATIPATELDVTQVPSNSSGFSIKYRIKKYNSKSNIYKDCYIFFK